MSVLDELGILHGTDKASVWRGEPRIIQGYPHRYLPFYEQYLEPLRDKEITLLEIGVENGFSLKMWRDYFTRGKIVGMDINEKYSMGERIELETGNQCVPADLERVIAKHGPFDVVIDDAGHSPDAQIFCFHYMLQHVKPGGFYILEDVAENEGVISHLCRLAVDVLLKQVPHIDSMAFSYGTSVTKIRSG